MSITIDDYDLPDSTHNVYDIHFYSDNNIIHTMVTHAPSMVDTWFSDFYCHHRNRRSFLVGLDVEWHPNTHRHKQNPVAVLQLCIGGYCLIFQILHAPFVPKSLIAFLSNGNHTFVGVGIEGDVEKLRRDYSLRVANFVDLRALAARMLGEPEMLNVGLKGLASLVLGKVVEKPKRITLSDWDNPRLNAEQVQYACVDAFLSYEIGRRLYSRRL